LVPEGAAIAEAVGRPCGKLRVLAGRGFGLAVAGRSATVSVTDGVIEPDQVGLHGNLLAGNLGGRTVRPLNVAPYVI
jgi:hypothetical protein